MQKRRRLMYSLRERAVQSTFGEAQTAEVYLGTWQTID
jgi:hypothetical protein